MFEVRHSRPAARQRLVPFRNYSFVIALFVLSSCLRPGSSVRLYTDTSRYGPGDTVQLTLSNGTRTTIEYNLCSTTLERKTTGWGRVKEERVCTMELHVMPSGGKDSTSRELPMGLEAGTYRFTMTINPGGESQEILSNDFRVTPAP